MPADIEWVLVSWATDQFPGARALTDLKPEDLDVDPVEPLFHVYEFDGADVAPGLSGRVVDIDTYAATSDEAKALAYELHERLMYQAPGYRHPDTGAVISKVTNQRLPISETYDDASDIGRFNATYTITVHSRG